MLNFHVLHATSSTLFGISDEKIVLRLLEFLGNSSDKLLWNVLDVFNMYYCVHQ